MVNSPRSLVITVVRRSIAQVRVCARAHRRMHMLCSFTVQFDMGKLCDGNVQAETDLSFRS